MNDRSVALSTTFVPTSTSATAMKAMTTRWRSDIACQPARSVYPTPRTVWMSGGPRESIFLRR